MTRKNAKSESKKRPKYWSKINSLRAADKFFKVFGSNEPWGGHQYRLNRVVKAETLSNFEKKYKIKLAAEYKEFITEFGNGGMGPAYGLIPLLKSVKGIRKNKVAEKFDVDNDTAANLIQTNQAEKLAGKPEWELSTLPIEPAGYLNLATYGDGEYAILILTGEQKGKIWYRSENRARPLYQEKSKGLQPMTFFDWYDAWLNESLEKVSVR